MRSLIEEKISVVSRPAIISASGVVPDNLVQIGMHQGSPPLIVIQRRPIPARASSAVISSSGTGFDTSVILVAIPAVQVARAGIGMMAPAQGCLVDISAFAHHAQFRKAVR